MDMEKIKEYKYNLLGIMILSSIILTLPVFFGNQYLAINNDTIAHLKVFEAIKIDNANFLYLGQRITGYELVWLEKVTGISLSELFMWFNFLALVIGGIVTMIVIEKITKSKVAGILSMFVITFGTGAIMHLFWSGTIFNIIEMIILFPITLLAIYLVSIKRNKRNIRNILFLSLSIVALLIYHPTFGIQTASTQQLAFAAIRSPITEQIIEEQKELVMNIPFVIIGMIGGANLTTLILSSWIIFKKKEVLADSKIVLAIGSLIAIGIGILAFSGITAFSSRITMNFAIIVNLITCLLAGLVLKNRQDNKVIKPIIISLLGIGIIPNLVSWIGKY